MKTTHRNLLRTSALYDSVEIIREGKPMKSIPRETIEATPKPEAIARNPIVILAGIWSLASVIAEGPDEVTASYGDRIGQLCAEMEAALLTQQLTASVKR